MADELIDRIKSRCFWRSVIRPERYINNRINYDRLFPIVRESAVSLRGWDFPHVDERREVRHGGQDWIGEELEWLKYLELWRMYQSGQFVAVQGLPDDWQGRSKEIPKGVGPSGILPLWDTIYRFTEVYEFAARLALTEAGDSKMRVEVKIGNLRGRRLAQDHPGRTALRHYQILTDEFLHDSTPVAREALIGQPREHAARALLELFQRFDFRVSLESIRSWQDELESI